MCLQTRGVASLPQVPLHAALCQVSQLSPCPRLLLSQPTTIPTLHRDLPFFILYLPFASSPRGPSAGLVLDGPTDIPSSIGAPPALTSSLALPVHRATAIMKLRPRSSALPLLLLLPSLAVGLGATDALPSSPTAIAPLRHLTPRAAPVDGKDGRPHTGPFVETDGTATDSDNNELPPLKGRPHDLTVVDGKKIPESNDGVMFDKNRERPQQGTTGMEGGVSAKAKARMAQEGETGERVLTQPQSPKEQPPLPHSEEQKLQTGDDKNKDKSRQPADKDKSKPKSSSDKDADKTDYTGLDVRRPIPWPSHRYYY